MLQKLTANTNSEFFILQIIHRGSLGPFEGRNAVFHHNKLTNCTTINFQICSTSNKTGRKGDQNLLGIYWAPIPFLMIKKM